MAGFQIIDAVALKETASAQVFEKFVQGIVHVNGKGVNESYVNASGHNTSSVAVPFVPLGEGAFRKLGATINGGQYNRNDAVGASSDYFYIPLLFVYDRTETLAKIMNDKAGYDLLGAKTDNIVKKMQRGVNALTLAVQIARNLNDSYESGEELYIEQESSNNSMYDNFIDANTALSGGDEAIGADYFPTEFRQGIFTPEGWGELKKEKDKYIYSDLAQEMLATGVLNPFTNAEASRVELREGYCGLVDGVPCYTLSPIIWKLATENCRFKTSNLGLAPFAFGDIKALVVSGVGTLRGFVSLGNIEVVPSQYGQGWVLQPLLHGGCVCISGKSVRPIVKYGFSNPVTSDDTKIAILPPESNIRH